MHDACVSLTSMPKMIQIRNVPDHVHRVMTERAAAAGMSLSAYLGAELSHLAGRPTMAQWLARVEADERVDIHDEAVRVLHELRDEMG